jgi:hypothetical protein
MEFSLNNYKDIFENLAETKKIETLSILFESLKQEHSSSNRIKIEKVLEKVVGKIFFSYETYILMNKLLKDKKVLSINSGVGFIQRILHNNGISIIATDKVPNDKNHVMKLSSVEAVKKYIECDTLMINYPDYVNYGDYGINFEFRINNIVSPLECDNCKPVVTKQPISTNIKFCICRNTNLPNNYKCANCKPVVNLSPISKNKKLCVCCTYTKDLPEDHLWKALKLFKGSTVIYVGEGQFGCNGSPRMWCELEKNWILDESYNHPNWIGYNSCIQVYSRKRT